MISKVYEALDSMEDGTKIKQEIINYLINNIHDVCEYVEKKFDNHKDYHVVYEDDDGNEHVFACLAYNEGDAENIFKNFIGEGLEINAVLPLDNGDNDE